MTDEELIKFLWKLLSDEVTDGDLPNENDFTIIKHEFENRGTYRTIIWPYRILYKVTDECITILRVKDSMMDMIDL